MLIKYNYLYLSDTNENNLKFKIMENRIIKSESEGQIIEITIGSMIDWLFNIEEISINGHDFIQKCTLGLTDETSELCLEDRDTLAEFYYTAINNK